MNTKSIGEKSTDSGGTRSNGGIKNGGSRGGRHNKGAWLYTALCWGLFLALQTVLFWSAEHLQWLAGGVSLRFAAPLTAGQTEKTLEYARGTDHGYAFTFWTEQPDVWIEANERTAAARLLAVCGNAARLMPQELLWGAPPAAPGGCAVSDALAWRLWGALDVAGMELTAGDMRYVVRGVFRDESLCLIVQNTPDGAAYENAEVYRMENGAPGAVTLESAAAGEDVSGDAASGDTVSGSAASGAVAPQNAAHIVTVSQNAIAQNAELSVAAALSFARSGGLGIPAHTVNGGTLAALARLLCWLPLALCMGSLLRRFARQLSARARRTFWGVGLFLFALCLPRLLAALPAAWLPTRWSDFAFWQSLLRSGAARVEAWFALPPQSVDVAAKWLLFRHGALCLGGCIAGRWALTKTQEGKPLPQMHTGEDRPVFSPSPARPQAVRSSDTPSARSQNTI